MLQNTIKHLNYTKFIKIKFDDNIAELLLLLKAIINFIKTIPQDDHSISLIIDANCSWTPDVYRSF